MLPCCGGMANGVAVMPSAFSGLSRLAAAAVVGVLVSALPALACGPGMPAAAAAVLPQSGALPDAALMDRAILAEVNARRCRAGLAPLTAAPGLRAVAQGHAHWMARSRQVSHHGGPRGQENLPRRLEAAGKGGRGGAENLAMLHLYQIDGRPIFVRNQAGCVFTDTAGRQVGRHSVASLAGQVVTNWMASPGHRANLMDPRLRHVGSAVAIAPGGRSCGQVYVTQVFAR